MRRQQCAMPAFARVFDRSHRDLRDPAAARPSFDGAALVISNRAAARQPHVSDLSGEIVSAAVEPPIDDNSRAESGAHREKDHVAGAAPRAVAMLGDRAGVGVILEVAADAELALEDCLDRNVDPRRKIGRRLDDTADSIEWAAATYADTANRRSCKPALLEQRDDSLTDKIECALRSFGG